MPIVGTVYPSIETLCNLVRARVNDTFKGMNQVPGEGRIFTDDAPFVLPFINAAMSKYQRDLDSAGVPHSTKEVFFFNLPPINSADLGVSQPNPATYQNLSYSGFYDGYQNYDYPYLPPDFIAPKKMSYRTSGTNNTFAEFFSAPHGLPSVLQNLSPGMWEYRNDVLYWNGATQAIDIQIRYTNLLMFYDDVNPDDFPTTPLPFRESVDCLAYLVAADFCEARLPPGATAELQAQYQREIDRVINRQVKAMQSTRYSRGAYGEDCG